jgi:hypothetical protein
LKTTKAIRAIRVTAVVVAVVLAVAPGLGVVGDKHQAAFPVRHEVTGMWPVVILTRTVGAVLAAIRKLLGFAVRTAIAAGDVCFPANASAGVFGSRRAVAARAAAMAVAVASHFFATIRPRGELF